MVAQPWHSWQGQWRGPLSLEGFKNQVDVALGNMGYWWPCQCWINSWSQ